MTTIQSMSTMTTMITIMTTIILLNKTIIMIMTTTMCIPKTTSMTTSRNKLPRLELLKSVTFAVFGV